MGRYQKKPTVVEAVLWDGDKISETTDWITDALAMPPGGAGSIVRLGDDIHIHTLTGKRVAKPGTWIVRQPNGEMHVVPAMTFAQDYEVAP